MYCLVLTAHAPQECCFLPQKPYMPLGTLRQQLLFPNTDATHSGGHAPSDEQLLQLAGRVRLPRVSSIPLYPANHSQQSHPSCAHACQRLIHNHACKPVVLCAAPE